MTHGWIEIEWIEDHGQYHASSGCLRYHGTDLRGHSVGVGPVLPVAELLDLASRLKLVYPHEEVARDAVAEALEAMRMEEKL